MGSARVGSNPIGVAFALQSAPNVFAPKHVHRNTKLLSKDQFDTRLFHPLPVTVAILAQGTSWADAATQAFFVLLPLRVHLAKCAELTRAPEEEQQVLTAP
jgi:hypothetical protein